MAKSKQKAAPVSHAVDVDGVLVFCTYDDLVSIDSIMANPKNPNKHPDHQINVLASTIKANGWRVPITISKLSGNVVRGHGRLQAAQQLGMTQVPVDYQQYGDEHEEMADLIADNTIPELSFLDPDLLKEAVNGLDAVEFDLSRTGIHEEMLDNLLDETPDDFFDPLGGDQEKTKKSSTQRNDAPHSESFLITFSSEEERQAVIDFLGIDGHKTVYTAKEILGD